MFLVLCFSPPFIQALSHEQRLVIPVIVEDDDDNTITTSSDNRNLDHNSRWQDDDDDDSADDDSADDAATLSIQEEIESLLQTLPSNLNLEKERRKQAATTTDTTTDTSSSAPDNWPKNNDDADDDDDDAHHRLDALPEESENADDDEDEQQAEDGLKIAWQYKKDVQRERLGHATIGKSHSSSSTTAATATTAGSTFCHSFDLQGRLSDQLGDAVTSKNCEFVGIPAGCASNGIEYFVRLHERLLPRVTAGKMQDNNNNNKVTRLFLYEPDILQLRTALPLLLSRIRQEKIPVVVLIVIKAWQQQKNNRMAALVSARRTVDVVLQAEGFASRQEYPPPSEFRMFQGLLRIPKATTVTSATANGGGGHFADLTTTKRPASDLFGLKRDRRKLHVQLLHIPPEDYAQGGGSVGGGGVRSGAGRGGSNYNSSNTDSTTGSRGGLGCASSGGGGGTSPLDF